MDGQARGVWRRRREEETHAFGQGVRTAFFLFGPVALCRECRVMVYSGEVVGAVGTELS